MTKKRKQKLSKKRLVSLLKKHKKIKIVFCNPYDDTREVEAERILTYKGTSLVRYRFKGKHGKFKFSRYSTSCFCHDLRAGHEPHYGFKNDKAKAIVSIMVDDVVGCRNLSKNIIAILVGPGFKRKVV